MHSDDIQAGVESPKLQSWVTVAVRVALVLALVLAVVALIAPSGSDIDQGTLTFRLRPLPPWEHGRVVLPLGPAGALSLRTHETPVELVADYRLSDEVPTVRQARLLLESRPALEEQAEAAFHRFVWKKVIWALAGGLLAGMLVAGVGRGGRISLLRAVVGGASGLVAVLIVGGVFAGITFATVDRSPAVQYQGLATNVPEMLRTVRAVAGESENPWRSVEEWVRGVSRVAGQLQESTSTSATSASVSKQLVTILVASDVHGNVVGVDLISSLARNPDNAISAVVLAGDQTVRGTEAEATIFAERLDTGNVPVLTIGGNHEDGPAMEVLAEAGQQMIGEQTRKVAGLRIQGEDDPLAFDPQTTPDAALLAKASNIMQQELAGTATLPDLLVLHDFAHARKTVEWAKQNNLPLTVVYGHDHVAGVRREGSVTLIDAGTGGAAGYLGVGKNPDQSYTFQLLDFTLQPEPRLVSVTTMKYTGPTGKAMAEYYPITNGPAQEAE